MQSLVHRNLTLLLDENMIVPSAFPEARRLSKTDNFRSLDAVVLLKLLVGLPVV
jgi:hypothetical protein